jgi:hypothetical protein
VVRYSLSLSFEQVWGGTIEGQVQGSRNVCAHRRERGGTLGSASANKEVIIPTIINLKNKKQGLVVEERRGTAAVEIRTAHIDDEDARVSLLEEERGEIFRRDALEVLGNGNLQLGLRYASFHLLLVCVVELVEPNAVFVVQELSSQRVSTCNLILDNNLSFY